MPSLAVLEHFHFLRPWWALALLPVAITITLQWWRSDESRGWNNVIAPHLLEALRVRQSGGRWFNPVSLSLVVMLLMITILMGPSWRQQPSPLSKDEAALVLLLDISSSMSQSDVQPSRLQRAKQKITDLLETRQGARTALIGFSGSAHIVLPLTNDSQILSQYLSALRPEIMPRNGKFPEYALPLVDRIAPEPGLPTTVVLITDGVSASSAADFASYFSSRPHQLLVWGIGSNTVEEGQIPLEHEALKQLASGAGGRYIDLSLDKSDIGLIARRIASHYVVIDDEAIPWLDSGYWLVLPTLALFALWFRKGWTLQWALPALLVLSMGSPQARADSNWFADLWLTPDQQGRLLLQQGHYREAAERFRDPIWKATAYYYAQDFKLAAEYFSRVDSETARFNRANALAHRRDYLPALRQYELILGDNPEHEGARNNRDIVQALVDEINRISASQADEMGKPDGSRELGEDDPQAADGAERQTFVLEQQQQFSADEILQDPAVNAMWLRSVQKDASGFLAIKFSMQLDEANQEAAKPDQEGNPP